MHTEFWLHVYEDRKRAGKPIEDFEDDNFQEAVSEFLEGDEDDDEWEEIPPTNPAKADE